MRSNFRMEYVLYKPKNNAHRSQIKLQMITLLSSIRMEPYLPAAGVRKNAEK
jgi:hypothetical protein